MFVEYAKTSPEDLMVQITAWNRGGQEATVHILPTLWFRNTWSWTPGQPKPALQLATTGEPAVIVAQHPALGERFLYCEGRPELLFTENETNHERLFGTANASPYVKDGINEYVIHDKPEAVNPARTGTKVSPRYQLRIAPGQSAIIRLRLTDQAPAEGRSPFGGSFDEVLEARRAEAQEFWDQTTPPSTSPDARNVFRQALSGMLWTKQFYFLDVPEWLREHGASADQAVRRAMRARNTEWFHMVNGDVISMPDKWEYPWFAAWDLAFHAVALSTVDVSFGKQQLELMLNHTYMHPNGQLPAYEWNFSDVNPPVHAWAAWFLYNTEKGRRGGGDIEFLQRCFDKLMLNFTWWVNRKDRTGRNVFEGGFLGLDNIGVFDRSSPLPTGGYLEQADGTAWMCFFSHCMFQISLELAEHNSNYRELALKFMEHFMWIATAMDRIGEHEDEMWDEEDGFFYDVLRLPDGSARRLKVRSLVGLLPLCAATIIETEVRTRFPDLLERMQWFVRRNREVLGMIAPPQEPGVADRRLLAILGKDKLRRVLAKMLDENEFLGPYGIRSLSRYHAEHPFVLDAGGQQHRVEYLPAESDTGVFGGNSNWRGPVWFPVNILIIRGLLNYYAFYGDEFKVECPTGSGKMLNLFEVSKQIAQRLISIFLRGGDGRRPVYGGQQKFQTDPNWRDHILFYEYFHGDIGAGIGASHQTGWTGLVATLIQIFETLDPQALLRHGAAAVYDTEPELQATGAR